MSATRSESSGNIAMLGLGLFYYPTGISRAVQTLADYFGRRVILVTDDLTALKTHPTHDAVIYWLTLSGHETTLRRENVGNLIRTLIGYGSNYAPLAFGIVKILDREKVARVWVNGFYQFCWLLPVILVARLLRRTELSLVIYDPEEFELARRIPGVKALFKARLVTDIFVLNSTMQRLVADFAKPVATHAMALGVSRQMLELAREAPQSIKDRIATSLPNTLFQDRDSIIVLFYGRLARRRRLEDLLDAFTRVSKKENLPASKLYLAGYTEEDIPVLNQLTSLASKLGSSDQIRFLGSLTPDELAYLYHRSDIFVFPAVRQAWGLAPLEAMAFGKPVIITEECGLVEVLKDKSVAIIIPARNSAALSEALVSLIRNRRRRQLLGATAKKFVEQNLTFHQTGRQLENIWTNEE